MRTCGLQYATGEVGYSAHEQADASMKTTKKWIFGLLIALLLTAFTAIQAQAKRHMNPAARHAEKRAKAQRKAMRRAAKQAQQENRQRAGTHK